MNCDFLKGKIKKKALVSDWNWFLTEKKRKKKKNFFFPYISEIKFGKLILEICRDTYIYNRKLNDLFHLAIKQWDFWETSIKMSIVANFLTKKWHMKKIFD